jgi:autotransporter passenger strand-loop-strand repeat protein
VVFGGAASTTVSSGGAQSVQASATASDTTVSSGGIQYDAGTASDTTLAGGDAKVWSRLALPCKYDYYGSAAPIASLDLVSDIYVSLTDGKLTYYDPVLPGLAEAVIAPATKRGKGIRGRRAISARRPLQFHGTSRLLSRTPSTRPSLSSVLRGNRRPRPIAWPASRVTDVRPPKPDIAPTLPDVSRSCRGGPSRS